MTKKEILALVCKILGIVWLLVFSFQYLSMLQYLSRMVPGLPRSFAIAASLVLAGGPGAALLLWATPIAGALWGKEADDVVRIGLKKEDLQDLAFSVVGLWMAVSAIMPLAGSLYSLVSESISESIAVEGVITLPAESAVLRFLQLCAGLVLLFFVRSIAGVVRKLRTAGQAGK